MKIPNCQALITRLPYCSRFDIKPVLEMAKFVDARGLMFVSMPIHVEFPNNGGRLLCELEDAGLVIAAKICWYRDRSIVTTKSKRLTNTWEVLGVLAKQKNYHINREAATKIKKGFEGREGTFDEDEYATCIGDHWPLRNDRRDRRFLPAALVLNCGQLADLQPGDRVLDPYGNPGIRDACKFLGWEYIDGGLQNSARNAKNSMESGDYENEDLSWQRSDEEDCSEGDSGSLPDRGSDSRPGRQTHSSGS